MNGLWHTLWQRLVETPVIRRAVEVCARAASRRHVAALERTDPVRAQTRLLLGMVHAARKTPFGRDHDFARIRTVDDFRRLVPLRTLEELGQRYDGFNGVTWPKVARRVFLANAGPELPPRPLPLSPALETARRAALRTALALVRQLRPHADLCAGSVVFLGESIETARLSEGKADARPTLTPRQLPTLTRPFAIDGATPEAVAHAATRSSVTCLSGPLVGLLRLVAAAKRITGRADLRDVWPNLTAVLWSRKPSDPPLDTLRADLADNVLLLEMASRYNTPLAIEEPHSGCLRWLPDHGAFIEFVPVGGTERVTFDAVAVGTDYELVLTSPAGLWACRLGETVRFERRDVPLFRFGERIHPVGPAVPDLSAAPRSAQPDLRAPASPLSPSSHLKPTPRRRSVDIPAALPGTFDRILS